MGDLMKNTLAAIFGIGACAGLFIILTAGTPAPVIDTNAETTTDVVVTPSNVDAPQAEPAMGCSRDYRFSSKRTDNAKGCKDKKGKLRCYSARHYPCKGKHTHGTGTWQELRSGVCKKIKNEKVVRCDGSFSTSGTCSGSTVDCGKEGSHSSGHYVGRKRVDR
jgi:hypothetical protein